MPGRAGVSGQQIINGSQYRMYSPQWYEAMEEEDLRTARNRGAGAGTTAGTAVNTLRDIAGIGGSSSGSSSGSGSGSGTAPVTPPRVTMPGASVPGGMPGGVPGGVPAPPASAAPRPVLSETDFTESDNAAFNRAKDTVGATTRASLTGLRSALASRGQLGGGGEFRGSAAIVQGGAKNLADTVRQQAIEHSQRNAERMSMQFQGDIALRGQDLTAAQAASALAARLSEVSYQGEITQRGQDLAAQSQQQSWQFQQQQQEQELLSRILAQLTPLY